MLPTSLTPIQTPNRVFSEVHGVVDGCEAMLLENSVTWSTKLRTSDSYGATRLASVVAPP